MKLLKIKRDDMISALTSRFDMLEAGWFLDSETGDVLLNSDAADDLPEDFSEDDPRYIAIDPIPSHEGFGIMEAFVENLGDAPEASRLADALDRPKPFRRFKDTLRDFPELEKVWFAFEEQEHERLAKEWCEERDIRVEWV